MQQQFGIPPFPGTEFPPFDPTAPLPEGSASFPPAPMPYPTDPAQVDQNMADALQAGQNVDMYHYFGNKPTKVDRGPTNANAASMPPELAHLYQNSAQVSSE